jgi:hypothetical protein
MILESITEKTALKEAAELAKGLHYDKPLQVSWKAIVANRTPEQVEKIREQYRILAEGDDLPNPCMSFEEMRFHDVHALISKSAGYIIRIDAIFKFYQRIIYYFALSLVYELMTRFCISCILMNATHFEIL